MLKRFFKTSSTTTQKFLVIDGRHLNTEVIHTLLTNHDAFQILDLSKNSEPFIINQASDQEPIPQLSIIPAFYSSIENAIGAIRHHNSNSMNLLQKPCIIELDSIKEEKPSKSFFQELKAHTIKNIFQYDYMNDNYNKFIPKRLSK